MATDPWELLREAQEILKDEGRGGAWDCMDLANRIFDALEKHDESVSLTWEPDENKQPIQYADYGKLTLTVGYYPSPTTTYPWVWSIIGKAYLRGGCSPTEEEAKAEAIKTVRSLA